MPLLGYATDIPLLTAPPAPFAAGEPAKATPEPRGLSAPKDGKTADSFLGIDFWKHDRLHVPNFAGSRNLLQNPSFEEDLRYYKDFGWATYPGVDRDVYTIDDKVAFSGKRSLKVKAWKDCKDPSVLATFAIPAVPGKKYTFSFYAKADSPKLLLKGRIVTGAWGTFPGFPSFELTNDWKRYETTFTAPNATLCMMFNVANNGDADIATAWVDGLQLEEADQASAYIEPPVAATLLTSKEGNFLSSSDPVNARIRINAAPNTKGTLACEITDFFYAKPYAGTFEFTTGADGEAVVKLPLEGKFGRGVFSVRTDVKMADAATFTEFHRVSVIDPAPASCPNKSIFGADMDLTSRSDFQAARFSYLGIGSCCYTSKEAVDKVSVRHGILNSGCGTSDYGPGAFSACVVKDRPALPGRLEKEPYSDSLRDDVRRISYEMAKAYPWIRTWFLQAESNCRKFKCEVDGDYAGYTKLILAAREGVLKADPTLKFMFEGGPSNMSPGGGIESYDKWLTAAGEVAPGVRFDAFAIHPYRPTPENPDLDVDADTYLKMLARHGYKTEPVYWNEGSYHCPWVVPEWGLNLGFCDQYRCGWFSYHMGWAERISAAWNARCWLAALKYSDRVRQLVSWAYHGFVFLDADGTVSALAKAPNTLCRLLGDAKFKKDIRFAVGCRAYVFEDAQGRPVAALWSHIPDVDRGLERSPVAKMRFEGPSPEFINFMENQVSPPRSEDGAFELPVTPFPFFVRGKPGTLDTLCAAIANATLSGTKDFALAVDMKLLSQTAAELSFHNRISRPFKGEAQAADQKFALSLPEGSQQAFAVNLPSPIPFDRIGKVSLPLKVSENGGESVEKDFSLYAFSSANATNWDAVPWIKLTNRKLYNKANDSGAGDFAAEFKTRWDKDALHLLVKVVDDKACFPQGDNSGGDWAFDSLQIYLDTLGDNANRKSKAIFDFNDYSYCVSGDAATGKARVWRQNAPAAQVGDAQANAMPNTVVTDIPATVTPTADGYIYEIAFPKWTVSPFQLKAGSFGRLALYVNDNDGAGREGGLVSTVDPDSEPYNNPEQWPGIILIGPTP